MSNNEKSKGISANILSIFVILNILAILFNGTYVFVGIIDERVVLNRIYIISLIILSANFIYLFTLLELKRKIERQEIYNKEENPDYAKTLRFTRKNCGVSVGRFNRDPDDDGGIALFFINERMWCCLMRHKDGSVTAHLPPEVKTYNENIKFIELINAKDLPRIS
jgi:hypothetical protein